MTTPTSPRKKVAVVLAGCGFLDGSEITEAISTLIALSEAGADYGCFAPNIDFQATPHHGDGRESTSRNVLQESARISRGHIKDIKDLRERDFDALVIPGGFGAALHLSTWARDGAKARVNPEVSRIITEFHKADKPIGALCIAPTLLAKVLGSENITITIGDDVETSTEIEKTGARHVKCTVTDYISDRDHKVLTTPAYMYGNAKPNEVFTGVRKLIKELVEMA